MHHAVFTVPCSDGKEAQVLHAAVSVEADEGPDGTTTTLRSDGSVLHVDITAQDLSGLRAAVHSALRLLDAARETIRRTRHNP